MFPMFPAFYFSSLLYKAYSPSNSFKAKAYTFWPEYLLSAHISYPIRKHRIDTDPY